jgi:hypothetical protein
MLIHYLLHTDRRALLRSVARRSGIVFVVLLLLIPVPIVSDDDHTPLSQDIARMYVSAEAHPDRYFASVNLGEQYLTFSQPSTAKTAELYARLHPENMVETPESNQDIVWNYLLIKGFSEEQAAGIMGNMMQEHRFRTDGDGICQWIGGRKTRLRKLAASGLLETQLYFMYEVELKGAYKHALNAVLESDTIREATIAFEEHYERAGIPAMGKRIAYAESIYSQYME